MIASTGDNLNQVKQQVVAVPDVIYGVLAPLQ
jgi:hypothetical protein